MTDRPPLLFSMMEKILDKNIPLYFKRPEYRVMGVQLDQQPGLVGLILLTVRREGVTDTGGRAPVQERHVISVIEVDKNWTIVKGEDGFTVTPRTKHVEL